jgi:hypothetical protein
MFTCIIMIEPPRKSFAFVDDKMSRVDRITGSTGKSIDDERGVNARA